MQKQQQQPKQWDEGHPATKLQRMATTLACPVTSRRLAEHLDATDTLRGFRESFHVPRMRDLSAVDKSLLEGDADQDCLYLAGNSLGLMPRAVRTVLEEELHKWATTGVYGHHEGARPWALCDETLTANMATLVGAEAHEVAVMNGLSINLHLLMLAFYKPTAQRYKIMLEAKSFPSDYYAMESQIRLRGHDPEKTMLQILPRQGEETLRLEDVLETLEREGDSIALVLFGGVQYYTGQLFDMPAITHAAHNKGCLVGFDLAHAVGNVEIFLHEWQVDFACWCSYKYLNSGAGGLAGAFIHEKHMNTINPVLIGWWGHKYETRMKMDNKLQLSAGVSGFRISNPPILLVCPLEASLKIFMEASMPALRAKSRLLTGYLELLLLTLFAESAEGGGASVRLITPSDPEQRGCQLSLSFSVPIGAVHRELKRRGIVCDMREPFVLRVAPTPLYNSFQDVWRFVHTLAEALKAVQ